MQQQQQQLQQHLQQHQKGQRIIGEVVRASEALTSQPATLMPGNVSPALLQQRQMINRSGSGNQPLQQPPVHAGQPGHVPPTLTSMSSTLLPTQSRPIPVGISVVPNGPQIVQVTYTPEGSNVPVSASSQQGRNPELIPLNSMTGRPMIKPRQTVQSAQRLNRFNVPLRPKSNMMLPGKMLSRPSSKLSPGALKILRRAQKRSPTPAVAFPNGCPTSTDFRNFVVQFPLKARRVLTHGSLKIDAIYVAQRKLFPPVICEGPNGKKQVKYPTNAARAFLTALADAGLGDMISRVGSRSGNSTFKKKNFNELSPAALAILGRLNITEAQYKYTENTLFP